MDCRTEKKSGRAWESNEKQTAFMRNRTQKAKIKQNRSKTEGCLPFRYLISFTEQVANNSE